MSMLTAFNNIILKFNDDLIDTFPEENDFKVCKNALLLLKKANPRKVLEIFKYYSINFKQKIESRDETFFLETDSKSLTELEDNAISNIIDKLRIYWKTLSVNNKDKIWQYLNTLLKLSEKC